MPWLGLGILTVLVLILAAVVAYFFFDVGQGRDTGPDQVPAVSAEELTEAARDARTAGRSGGALGFPAAATRNTTRISGTDPVEFSIAAAFAAYPTSGPGAPPAAVTIADAKDWQAGVAAATLSARPVGAPILLAPSGRLSEAGSNALDQLNPQGSPETGENRVFTVGKVTPPGGIEAKRVTGSDPATLAVELARLKAELTDGPPNAFVLVSSEAPEFASPAATWIARSGDVVLYTDTDEVPQATLDFLKEKQNRKVPVFVLGPSKAVSSKVIRSLGKVVESVERVGGEEPATAAVDLARFYSGEFGWNLNDPGHGFTLARADRPMDVVATTALSTGGTWPALLLTESKNTLPDVVHQYLLDIKPGYDTDPTRALYNHVWIVGDESLIDVNQQARVDDAAELTPVDTLDR